MKAIRNGPSVRRVGGLATGAIEAGDFSEQAGLRLILQYCGPGVVMVRYNYSVHRDGQRVGELWVRDAITFREFIYEGKDLLEDSQDTVVLENLYMVK